MEKLIEYLYELFRIPRQREGTLTLAPSQGEVVVMLDWRPNEVQVYFLDTDPNQPPTCAELVDDITKIRILPRGFRFDYVLDSGIRTIEWKARR